MSYNNNDEIQIESEFNGLNISDGSSAINHKYCHGPDNKLWCKECVPHCLIEGWTSGNDDIDEFIKDTIYNAEYGSRFLEWVPFDRFEDIEQIGEGGFAKVYSAMWIDGEAKYIKQDDGSWKKEEPEPLKIALKKLNDSQNILTEYLNEVIFYKLFLITLFNLY
jgi:hypothetical protein